MALRRLLAAAIAASSCTLSNATIIDAGVVTTVIVEAPLFDTRTVTAGGCGSSGCVGHLTRDGDLATFDSRWSCKPSLGPAGSTCFISYSLGDVLSIRQLKIAMYKGDERSRTMDVYVDGVFVTSWTSSGSTTDFQTVDLNVNGQTVEMRAVLDDSEWISVMEVEVIVWDGTTMSTPSPEITPTLSTATSPPVTAPTGDLQKVVLIPMASGGSSDSDFELYSAKDGDFSTSWSCTGGPRNVEQRVIYYECTLGFSLEYYRNIKQVKIALSDGDERQMDMRISGVYNSEAAEEFVTSSGTTTDLEMYDFEYFTKYIRISGVFATEGETINISEVEFYEEVRPDEVSVVSFSPSIDSDEILGKNSTVDGFRWFSDSDEALDEQLTFSFSSFATVTAMELQFPLGDTYMFDLWISNDADGTGEPFATLTGFESANAEGWQTFDLGLDADQIADEVTLVMKGTGSGAPGFYMSNARFIGSAVANPTDTFYVGSTYITEWYGSKYPDFVAEGSGDQRAIMGAICAVKKATFDGVDCVGEDVTATGTVHLSMGSFFVDGNIFMKSGVLLDGRYSIDDSPNETIIQLEDGAAGNTAIGPILVMNGISNAQISELWIRGQYDSETDNSIPAVKGLGSTCISITSSQDIKCLDSWIDSCDGDGWVVRDSNAVDIDAGSFDEEYLPWPIDSNRGTGLVVDKCDDVWVRRYAVRDNGVAGIHISDSTNFLFEATIGSGYTEGDGVVGSTDGQQPIEVVIENSSLITFQDMKVISTNDPVMTISADCSDVVFNNCGFSNVETGTCVIQAEDPAAVTADDEELALVDNCYVKV